MATGFSFILFCDLFNNCKLIGTSYLTQETLQNCHNINISLNMNMKTKD